MKLETSTTRSDAHLGSDLVRGGDVHAVRRGDGDRAVHVLDHGDRDRARHVDWHVALVGDSALTNGYSDSTVGNALVHNAGGTEVCVAVGVAVKVINVAVGKVSMPGINVTVGKPVSHIDVAMGVHVDVGGGCDVTVSEPGVEGRSSGVDDLVSVDGSGAWKTVNLVKLSHYFLTLLIRTNKRRCPAATLCFFLLQPIILQDGRQ